MSAATPSCPGDDGNVERIRIVRVEQADEIMEFPGLRAFGIRDEAVAGQSARGAERLMQERTPGHDHVSRRRRRSYESHLIAEREKGAAKAIACRRRHRRRYPTAWRMRARPRAWRRVPARAPHRACAGNRRNPPPLRSVPGEGSSVSLSVCGSRVFMPLSRTTRKVTRSIPGLVSGWASMGLLHQTFSVWSVTSFMQTRKSCSEDLAGRMVSVDNRRVGLLRSP